MLKLAATFKAVAIVGPRQAGKTTLTKMIFPGKPYVSLENPDIRQFAETDPRGFLRQYEEGAILDEVQRVPALFSYLQQLLDESTQPGRFILTGSNNFLLQENLSQTLAGRIAYFYLLPFSKQELKQTNALDASVDEQMWKGFYPPVYHQQADTGRWYQNYIRTYVERDVRQIKNITHLTTFEKFIRLCAGRCGQLLNLSSLGIEAGVDHKTVLSWLVVLESSFVVFRLQPYHRSFNKRLVKMPKLYFYDTGLACSLLGIRDQSQLAFHPLRGALFENLVVAECMKQYWNRGEQPPLFFWRDNKGAEVDLVVDKGDRFSAVEIKAGETLTADFFTSLEYWQKISGAKHATLVYAGSTAQKRSSGITVVPWRELDIHTI